MDRLSELPKPNVLIEENIPTKGNILFFEPPEGVVGPGRVAVEIQVGHHDCCTASLYALLCTLGINMKYEDLYSRLGTTKDGVGNTSIIKQVLEQSGLPVQEFNSARVETLIEAVRGGSYCLVEYQAPDSDYQPEALETGDRKRIGKSERHGHWSLVFGISKDGKRVWLMDPLINGEEVGSRYGKGIRVMSLNLLRKRWKDADTKGEWMLTVQKRLLK